MIALLRVSNAVGLSFYLHDKDITQHKRCQFFFAEGEEEHGAGGQDFSVMAGGAPHPDPLPKGEGTASGGYCWAGGCGANAGEFFWISVLGRTAGRGLPALPCAPGRGLKGEFSRSDPLGLVFCRGLNCGAEETAGFANPDAVALALETGGVGVIADGFAQTGLGEGGLMVGQV